jgi:hypothetical protein
MYSVVRIEIIYCWDDWEVDLPLSLTIIYEAMKTQGGREALRRDAEKRCDSTMLYLLSCYLNKEASLESIRNFYMLNGIHMIGLREC